MIHKTSIKLHWSLSSQTKRHKNIKSIRKTDWLNFVDKRKDEIRKLIVNTNDNYNAQNHLLEYLVSKEKNNASWQSLESDRLET